MTVQLLSARAVDKPWGRTDLRPWSNMTHDGEAVGELWFEPSQSSAPDAALQLKLLLTQQALSVQVHPDDAYARSVGLKHGKTEAWYVLSATPDAEIGLGLIHRVTAAQLRSAIMDGSIGKLIEWRHVRKDDVVLVPAGTIHAIGAGLVVAEIQQRSDTTYRLFDYGSGRELHVDSAVAAATRGPAGRPSDPVSLSAERTILLVDPHFVLERVELPARTGWSLHAERETWFFAISGAAQIGPLDLQQSGAVLAKGGLEHVEVGNDGLTALVAYPGPEVAGNLLRKRDGLRDVVSAAQDSSMDMRL